MLLAHYFKPSTLATSSGSFFKHLTLYNYSDFKLDIYIVQKGYESLNDYKLQSLVLSLEQYYIFTFNSTLNTIKVAGIAPIAELTEKGKASITENNSTPVYIYDNGKLVYICPSAAQLKRETGISRSTIGVATANHLVYGKFTITQNAPSDINTTSTYLLATEGFIKQIQEARTAYANMPKAHLTPENLLASNTQKNWYYCI